MNERQIEGADDLKKAFKEFGPKFENRVMRAAINAGAEEFIRIARYKARRLPMSATGRRRLRQAISFAKVRKRKGKLTSGLFIRSLPKVRIVRGRKIMTNDPHVWSRWFNEGTKDRYRGGRGKAAKHNRTGRKGYTGKIIKYGFLDDTWTQGVDKALETFSKVAAKRVTKYMNRIARQKARQGK